MSIIYKPLWNSYCHWNHAWLTATRYLVYDTPFTKVLCNCIFSTCDPAGSFHILHRMAALLLITSQWVERPEISWRYHASCLGHLMIFLEELGEVYVYGQESVGNSAHTEASVTEDHMMWKKKFLIEWWLNIFNF